MLNVEVAQKTTSIIDLPVLNLPAEDGIPLESNWHRIEMNLLIDILHYYWEDRNDYFMGGNMFIYYSAKQVLNEDYKGPDFFLVKEVDGSYDRNSWILWEEDGRYPDLIIELASPTTIKTDLNLKKNLYEKTFHTHEYFCYDPQKKHLMGWRLNNNKYQALKANNKDWLWSEEVGLWLGIWYGTYQGRTKNWLRFYDADGKLVHAGREGEAKRAAFEAKRAEAATNLAAIEAQRAKTESQRAKTESQRAKTESQRAKTAEEETKRLAALLAKHGIKY